MKTRQNVKCLSPCCPETKEKPQQNKMVQIDGSTDRLTVFFFLVAFARDLKKDLYAQIVPNLFRQPLCCCSYQ